MCERPRARSAARSCVHTWPVVWDVCPPPGSTDEEGATLQKLRRPVDAASGIRPQASPSGLVSLSTPHVSTVNQATRRRRS